MEWNRDRIETENKREREGEFWKEGRRIFKWNGMELRQKVKERGIESPQKKEEGFSNGTKWNGMEWSRN